MTATEFRNWAAPAFADTANPTDAQINTAIAAAAPYFDVTRWGGFYTDGLANWVAHRLSMKAISLIATNGLDNTDAVSKSVGDVSVSKSQMAVELKMKNPYMKTLYGQEYWRLVQLVGIGALAVDQPTMIEIL